ncbi:hypothetical protein CK203_083291 [Vitis vinifera]|uniref:Uncharacterized protein n=1 Tax=Vitis vinifera TaxID=29760 RepID=A0A438CZT8_VITVI|nr:hypothetical protein CK203_083291 [Vitis vinifera]
MDKKKVAVPLVCHGHSRPVVDLFYSPVTPDGFFLISASKVEIVSLLLNLELDIVHVVEAVLSESIALLVHHSSFPCASPVLWTFLVLFLVGLQGHLLSLYCSRHLFILNQTELCSVTFFIFNSLYTCTNELLHPCHYNSI